MPDILIRGMEYPKSCSRCDFASVVPGEVWCKRAKEIVPEEQAINVNMRPTFCPLHELPAHGDLIDADALKAKAEYDRKHLEITGYERELLWHYLDVAMAPVVIPASEEGNHDEP